MPRSLLAVAVAALASMVPAAAWAQDGPTLTFDKPCYAKGDPMEYSGAGYTPGGEIKFLFRSLSNQSTGTYDTQANTAGALAGTIEAPSEDDVLDAGDISGMLDVEASDGTRSAGAAFRLTRWDVQVQRAGGRVPKARKPMRVRAYGFTRAIGKPLYVQYAAAASCARRSGSGSSGASAGI